jgi:tetratricopeptide (TPR) repeat protein
MAENTNNIIQQAEELFNQEKFDEVIKLLTDKKLETQKNAELYAWKAMSNYKLGINRAKNMFYAEKSINVDPNYFMGYFVRALILADSDRKEYDKAIKDYTKAIELNMDFADAYYNRGLAWQNLNKNDKANEDYGKASIQYDKDIKNNPKNANSFHFKGLIEYNKPDYKEAIINYTKAIEINTEFADAYYNRGLAYFANKQYVEAIQDYTDAIRIKPKYADVYYYNRGNAWKAKEKYSEAIDDYTRAIKKNPKFENAYYNRGLVRKEKDITNEKFIDIKGSKHDFNQYLNLTADENDIGVRYAKSYLKKLDEIKDTKLSDIKNLILEIKDILRIDDECITHYTSLSTMKELILTDTCKFWIFEGNFMNDPSEGREFFSFLYSDDKRTKEETKEMETFVPKHFIGSFVIKEKNNDLNMWRFYGKEDGVEAKGCSITLNRQGFIEDIKNSLSNEKNKEARIDDESDVNFYRVVYMLHQELTGFKFSIPNSDQTEDLKGKMKDLKDKVKKYKGNNRISVQEYLNDIAFLFKRADYENENEVRLVMNGIEFEKKFFEEKKEDKSINPPRVYIELEPIRKKVKQITLGPKVEKANEWASALYYSYKKEDKVPEIKISHLPYK